MLPVTEQGGAGVESAGRRCAGEEGRSAVGAWLSCWCVGRDMIARAVRRTWTDHLLFIEIQNYFHPAT